MLIFLLVIAVLCGLVWGAHAFWQHRMRADLADSAAQEYAHLQQTDPQLIEGMDEAEFSRVYERVEMPRSPGYTAAAIIAFLAGTPVFLALLTAGDYLIQRWLFSGSGAGRVTRVFVDDSGQTRVFDDVPPEAAMYFMEDLGGFYYFFGLLIFWIAIMYYFMRRHHAGTPGTLRQEILRSR